LKVEADNLIEVYRTNAEELAAADLDNEEWNKARAVHLTRYWSGEEAPSSRHAEARVLRSARSLCARFVCRQAEPLVASAHPRLEEKTMGLWDRDVCEIFVATEAQTPERYFEFEAAPTGEWVDLAIEHKDGARQTDWDYASGMTCAARIEANVITIALCIPWRAFGREPQEGERWRANLFRCIGDGPTRGYLAWQPTYAPEPNFHVPSALGWLEFK
jgi:hypothetical protein